MLKVEIKKLTPDLAEDYACFFDTTPHWDHADREKLPCYCVIWRSDDTLPANQTPWYPTREERRERAIQFVQDGKLQGYLAYHGERIVGWCNTTADCQGGVNYLRNWYPIEEYRRDVRVKSIFCFMIAPDMQRKGIATKLVEHICKDAAADGFDFVEAYPNVKYNTHESKKQISIYETCRFTKSIERNGKVV
ncbi:MAG: GNAT family N-acetyltransferase, partial [Phycisphaerales bacterium]|nr:GNAT family N-acetyltransferase [Phycisphaerales bacterium]